MDPLTVGLIILALQTVTTILLGLLRSAFGDVNKKIDAVAARLDRIEDEFVHKDTCRACQARLQSEIDNLKRVHQ
jgi:hypothetical protein